MGKPLTGAEQARLTYELRDPDHETILVGSAAVALHLAGVGYNMRTPVNDLDALGPADYIDAHRNDTYSRGKAAVVATEYGYGDAAAPVLRVDPDAEGQAMGILPFTAHVRISDAKYEAEFATLSDSDLTEVSPSRIPAMTCTELLRWMAIVGRQRDVRRLNEVLPVAADTGLVTPTDVDEIRHLTDRAADKLRT